MDEKYEGSKKILELNLDSPLLVNMCKIRERSPQDAVLKECIEQIYDNCRLMESDPENGTVTAARTVLKKDEPNTGAVETVATDTSDVRYSDFLKMLDPDAFIPLEGGKESLVLVALPGDGYRKLYSFSHDKKEFTPDNYGDENYQIYRFNSGQNNAEKIYDDGQTAYIISNHENKNVGSVYGLNTVSKTLEALTGKTQNFNNGVADRQGKYLALVSAVGANQQELFILNLQDKSLKKILAKKAPKYMPIFFDNEGKYLYLDSDVTKIA
ncbi:hypothetical protein CHS0354_002089 [Potamilus streckersoni]|uniref:Uncharacterized protein n=1 Tax=Potamilus streckersoni TaxID=2493646 RepID=A0AAE0T5T4_9BIVA|nr:hypothetical protein CHS0354_002089 [Potamilus streckersoni]